jgi:serine protease
MKSFFVVAVLLLSLLFAHAPSNASQGITSSSQKPFIQQLIIKFRQPRSDVTAQHFDAREAVGELNLRASQSLSYVREMSGDAHVLALPQAATLADANAIAQQLMRESTLIEYAEPDLPMFATAIPNDDKYSVQWSLKEVGDSNYGINMPGAWDITTGSDEIVIAVIDSGIRYEHPDLVNRTLAGYDFISNVTIANDGNGRDSDASDPGDWYAANACGSGMPGSNSSWHGTFVAGIIGAATNNTTGMSGINWKSKILPVRVLGKCGGVTSDIVDSMRWAAGISVNGAPNNPNPARVINLSLGGDGNCSSTWQSAINEVVARGVIVVIAAGNEATDIANISPANCTGGITVGATTKSGSEAYYSNFGTALKISAPGGDIKQGSSDGVFSASNSGLTSPSLSTYAYGAGTSFAAPHVSGVVSLMLSVRPSLTSDQVIQIIRDTATPFPDSSNCNTSRCGAGILNAQRAVAASVSYGAPDYPKQAWLPLIKKSN